MARNYKVLTWIFIAVLVPLHGFAEKPISADSIAGSVGINVHLRYTNTPYANFFLVQNLLTDLRVRHIRDGVVDTTWHEYYKRHNALGRQGIHCVYVTSPKQSDAAAVSIDATDTLSVLRLIPATARK